MRQHQRRPRGGRSNNTHSSNQNRKTSRHHVFDSNGPDGKIRGTAQQVYEKYITLARDAASSGDRVTAENHYQHAEHYFRIWSVAAEEEERWAAPNRSRFANDHEETSYDGFDHADAPTDEAEQPAMAAMTLVNGDFAQEDEIAQMPQRAAQGSRQPSRREPRMPRSRDEGRSSVEARMDRRRENWREARRTPTARAEQPVAVDYDAPVDMPVRDVVAQDAGGLYQERMKLDRVVSARRETRAPRTTAVRRERRPGPDSGLAVGGQSPVAQLLSEAEAMRETVDA